MARDDGEWRREQAGRRATAGPHGHPALATLANADDALYLFGAVFTGNASEVKAALAAGADPNARRVGGYTPLHWAAASGNAATVAALIQAGADPSTRDEDGAMPLHLATWFNANFAVIAALIQAGANPSARNG